ncbi:MAG: hypothetical protein R3D53_14135 [Paracoccaceae bacterium]
MPPEIAHAPSPNPLHGIEEEALRHLDRIFASSVTCARGRDDHRAGAGRGRFHHRAQGLLKRLREICDQHGIVMILDEVQAGMAHRAHVRLRTWPAWCPT